VGLWFSLNMFQITLSTDKNVSHQSLCCPIKYMTLKGQAQGCKNQKSLKLFFYCNSTTNGPIHTAPWPHCPNENVFSNCQNWLYGSPHSLRLGGRLFQCNQSKYCRKLARLNNITYASKNLFSVCMILRRSC